MILPELISKEPLGPAVRRGDDEFFAIAKWVVYALIEAEEYGITQANVDKMKNEQPTRSCSASLGTTEDTGKLLGLDKDWAYRAIKAVGNYGEIFERNVGPKTPLEAAARHQQPVEQGRPDVRPAGALTSCCRPRASGTATSRAGARCRAADASRRAVGAPWRSRRASATGRWRSQALRGLVYQVLAVLADRRRRLVPGAQHAGATCAARGIQSGFDFLPSRPASTSARR